MAHERLYLSIVLAGSLFAGVKAREWRTGIVEKTAYARQDEGGGGNVAIAESNSGGNSNPAPSVAGMAAAAAAMRISRTWHGFRITGNGYAFIVAPGGLGPTAQRDEQWADPVRARKGQGQ
jgi:hypothetical protein